MYVSPVTRGPRVRASLLDRLTDRAPADRRETTDRWLPSPEQLRESVRRDLAWLFNATSLASGQDLSRFRLAQGTVINFGIPDLAGRCASGVDAAALATTLQRAIRDFEPRLVRSTVRVQPVPAPRGAHPNALAFLIEADLQADPVRLPLRLRTELDLETGQAAVTEAYGE
jgi:type VI secretion system protein ImpF